MNPFSLKDKVILITGASSGIGRACAIECARAGASVIITGRNAERLDETFRMLPAGDHLRILADLTSEEDLEILVKGLPVLNGIILCAGQCDTRPCAFLNRKKLTALFDVNFFAPALLLQKTLKSQKIAPGGSIVFISSIDGPKTVHGGNSNYAATKGALSAFMKGVAVELAQQNIRANAILPGMTETPLIYSPKISSEQLDLDRKNYPLRRYGDPKEIAFGAIYFLSDAASWTTGAELVIDGGFTLL